jgi:hypothetical protein
MKSFSESSESLALEWGIFASTDEEILTIKIKMVGKYYMASSKFVIGVKRN